MEDRDQSFLKALYDQTGGNTGKQVSMYVLGESLGWDRPASSRTAEDLIGAGLAEVKTLSGGIGITDSGIEALQQAGCIAGKAGGDGLTLGQGPVLDAGRLEAVQRICVLVQSRVIQGGIDYDRLSEAMADLKTLDVQLLSPRPKTAIVREALRSLRAVMAACGAGVTDPIDRILGPQS